MTLFYVPLECYPDRYTMQLSAAKTGWWEKNLYRTGVTFQRIEGQRQLPLAVKDGVVLDPFRRTEHAFCQVTHLLELAKAGLLKDSDVIYFEDFWHPGFEALPYTFHQLGIRPRMYAFCHAQSVDEYDFTYPMRGWMRYFERGIGQVLDGIFTSCPSMKEKLVECAIAPRTKVHACGHVWDTEEVMNRMPRGWQDAMKPGRTPMKMDALRFNQVVFSSRWDKEKNPDFFLKVAEAVIAKANTTKFVICTSQPKIRSNDSRLLTMLDEYLNKYPDNIFLKEGLTKEQYYRTLCESKIQFNCSDQDWVSYVLLEASAAGCYPIYPAFRSFPETFLNDYAYLYQHKSVESAVGIILSVLSKPDMELWSPLAVKERSWIHRRYDHTWMRMLDKMGVPVPFPNGVEAEDYKKDPFGKSVFH